MSNPWLTRQEFKARTLIPAVNLDSIERIQWRKTNADSAADSVTPETRIGEIVVDGDVVATIRAAFAVVADPVNFATISVSKRTAGGSPGLLASIDTAVDDIPAGVTVQLPIVLDDVTAEDEITLEITKDGTGVIVPALFVEVRQSPSFVERHLAQRQSWIEDRLRKRYAIPFVSPFPETCKHWLVQICTPEIWAKLGWNPSSAQDQKVIDDAVAAAAEVLEAANSESGLFDLPLRQDISPDQTGIVKGAPLFYSETSPYVAFDVQLETASGEDSRRSGT